MEEIYVVVYREDNTEYTEEYEDFEDARVDYFHRVNGDLGSYDYVVLQQVLIEDNEETINIIGEEFYN